MKTFKQFINNKNKTRLNEWKSGSEYDIHLKDFPDADFTIEYNLKHLIKDSDISPENMQHEFETFEFSDRYVNKNIWGKILKKVDIPEDTKSGTPFLSINDWSFVGQQGGWLVIKGTFVISEDEVDDDEFESNGFGNYSQIFYHVADQIDEIMDKETKNFQKELEIFYKNR